MSTSVSTSQILLLSHFLTHLRQRGFTIGVDHYLRLQKLLDQIGADCDSDGLKTLLCPIFATSGEQQEQFYLAFDSWLNLLHPDPKSKGSPFEEPKLTIKEHKQETSRKWFYILAGILIVVLIIFVLMATKLVPWTTPNNSQTENTIPETTDLGNQTGQEPQLPLGPQPESESLIFQYWEVIAFVITLALLGLYFLARRYSHRDNLVAQKHKSKKPPYTWSIKVPALPASIYEPSQFYKAARRLQHRVSDEYSALDIQASIERTVQLLGHTALCYKQATKSPEYLILIERASFNDHQSQFFSYLAKRMEQAGLFWVCYFYTDDPKLCWDESGQTPVTLEELQHGYPGHRLLIFGDGKGLIDPIAGGLERWISIFSRWDDRAIMTPEAPSRWGWPETVLAEQFIVLPATLEGLLLLDDYFERTGKFDPSSYNQIDVETLSGPNLPETVEALRSYLGEDTFQWLCACAVYNDLHWDLTLYLGLLLDKRQEFVREREVLKLIHLPWFRQGFIPDEARLLLIDELMPENERIVRYAIINLLEQNIPPIGTFAADAHRLSMAVQRWLYYRDRKTYGELSRLKRTLPQSLLTQDQTVLRLLRPNWVTPFDFVLPHHIRVRFDQKATFVFKSITESAFRLLQKLLATIRRMYVSIEHRVLYYFQELLLYFYSNRKSDRYQVGDITTAATPNRIKILFLAANPADGGTRLRIEKDVRYISQRIRTGKVRDRVKLIAEWAVRTGDLQDALLRYKPDIVHFTGHGSLNSAIMLEDGAGNRKIVSRKALSSLFGIMRDTTQVVVLDACYGKEQAQALATTVDFTIVINANIGDEGAIIFAAYFYQALAFGRSVKEAFNLGVTQLKLEGRDLAQVPILLVRQGVDAAKSRIGDPSGHIVKPQRKPAVRRAAKAAPDRKRARLIPSPQVNSNITDGKLLQRETTGEMRKGKDHYVVFLPWLFAYIASSLTSDILRRFLGGAWPEIAAAIIQPVLIGLTAITAILIITTFVFPANLLVKKAASMGAFGDQHKARRNAFLTGTALVVSLGLWLSLPVFARFYSDRGFEYQMQGNLSRARESYQLTLRLEPAYAQAHYNLATIYEDLQPDEAMQEYLLAIKYDPNLYPAYNNLARMYLLRGKDNDSENAVRILEQTLDLASLDERGQYSVYKNLGWANYALKNYAQAEMYLRRAISLRKGEGGAAAHCLLAYVLKEQGKPGVLEESEDCLVFSAGDRDVQLEWINDAKEQVMKGEDRGTIVSPKQPDTADAPCGTIVLIDPREPKGMLRIKAGQRFVQATEGMLVRRGSLLILEPTARAKILCGDGRMYDLIPGPQGCPCTQ